MKQCVEFRKLIAVNHNSSLGITIPKPYTKNLRFKKGDFIQIQQIADSIVIKKIRGNEE